MEPQSGDRAPVDHSRIWLSELVQRFADGLASNEVACTLRLVNKAAAAHLNGPQDRTVRLSLPVPHAEFARRWGGVDAMRSLTQSQRTKLACLTARSGCIANLEVLLAREGRGRDLNDAVLTSAAAGGRLEVCRWLQLQGCVLSPSTLSAAAGNGHRALCEWLLASGCCASDKAAGGALRSGHVGLADWLLGLDRRPDVAELLLGMAHGCDLPTLQRLHRTYIDATGAVALVHPNQREDVLAAAAASPTPDWRAKVEWLERQHYNRSIWPCRAAVRLPDGRARLEWLQQRGYPFSGDTAVEAAGAGNLDAWTLLLDSGVQLDVGTACLAAARAAGAGHVAVLQALRLHQAPGFGAAGVHALRDAGPAAAAAGRLPVVEWLVGQLGARRILTARVFRSAAFSGSMELLTWLHAHGCPWDASVFAAAAEWGSAEQLEWLAARGCPMGCDGEPYTKALQYGGLSMLRCLKRLGCPWDPCGRTFTQAILCGAPASMPAPPTLCWLLEQGCPVDWGMAAGAARGQPELLAWLKEQRGR